MDRVKRVYEKVIKLPNGFFNFWEKYKLFTNLMISLLPIGLYFGGYLSNIRENTGSIISYAAVLVTLNGVFLTLLVTLKGSPIFIRLKTFFPKLHNYLYTGLKNQVKSCIVFMLLNLFISLVGPISNIYFISVGIVCWSYYLVDVSIGSFYNLKIVTDLALDKSDGQDDEPMT